MSSNSSTNSPTPESPAPATGSAASTGPDYVGLVHFLLKPFLELPESLKVDCETSNSTSRVWIRVAFEGTDKGRVFGRGGRNIQAIRTAIAAAGIAAGQVVNLDVFGSSTGHDDRDGSERRSPPRRSPPRRSSGPRSRPR